MNHPRRLLLFVPLALLGATLLVRARLPRPQTVGDKWLWEMAEKTPSLVVSRETRKGAPSSSLRITDRQGIRDVLRSFVGTSIFGPLTRTNAVESPSPVPTNAILTFFFEKESPPIMLSLLRGSRGYVLLRESGGGPSYHDNFTPVPHIRLFARTDKEAVKHAWQAMQKAQGRVRQHRAGYNEEAYIIAPGTGSAPPALIRATPPPWTPSY